MIIPGGTNSPALLRGSGVTALLMSRPGQSPNPHGELNDVNTSQLSARVVHRDRQVIAQVDLPLRGLDAHALRSAIGLVDDVAVQLMPTLATVFGGSLGGDAGTVPARRPDTTVYAEVVPGTMTVPNGPDTDDWPFPAAVHVITARTVRGSPRSADTNDRIRRAISVDIVERGARFVDGEAHTSSDEVGEPCLVTWGLSRSAVVAMARRAGQDSIFEIDADEVRLVSCLDATTLSWLRGAEHPAE